MSSRPALVASIALALFLAGCVSSELPGEDDAAQLAVPDDWWLDMPPSTLSDPDHDHGERGHHTGLTTANYETLGWDPLVTSEFDSTLVGMGCGGAVTREDGRRLAVVHSISTTVSFVVADVSDPGAPEMVGEFYLPNAVVWDATISADGEHVLIGAYPPGPVFGRDPSLPVPPAPVAEPTPAALVEAGLHTMGGHHSMTATDVPAWAAGAEDALFVYRSACTGEVTVAEGPANYVPGPAIVMAGIQDPASPTFEDYVPQPVIGPHSVGSQMIDGVVYATSSVTNLVHEGSYYTFFEITDTPAGSRLVTLSVLETPGQNSQRVVTDRPGSVTPFLNGHTDVYLHKHPVTDQLLAYLANWDGLYVYDLSTPQAPLPVSTWFDGKAGNVHTTFPFPELRDGKQYMIVAQEVGEPVDLPSGWVYLLDVTDPTAPEELGRWTLPTKPEWGENAGLRFSPHYVAVANDTLFVTNYHGGLWAVDISDMTTPQAVGIFVPELDSPAGYGGRESFGPSVGDVIYDPTTGVLTTWDNAGGVYQLRFHADVTAPKAPVWDVTKKASDS